MQIIDSKCTRRRGSAEGQDDGSAMVKWRVEEECSVYVLLLLSSRSARKRIVEPTGLSPLADSWWWWVKRYFWIDQARHIAIHFGREHRNLEPISYLARWKPAIAALA